MKLRFDKLSDEQKGRMLQFLEAENHHDIVTTLLGKKKMPSNVPIDKTLRALFYTALFILIVLLILFVNAK